MEKRLIFEAEIEMPLALGQSRDVVVQVGDMILPLHIAVLPAADRWVQLFYLNSQPRPTDPEEASGYEKWLHADLLYWETDDISETYHYRVPGHSVFLDCYPTLTTVRVFEDPNV